MMKVFRIFFAIVALYVGIQAWLMPKAGVPF